MVIVFLTPIFGITAVTGVIADFAIIPLDSSTYSSFHRNILMVSSFSSNDTILSCRCHCNLPYLANYIMTRFNNSAGEVVAGISEGIVPLGNGAMFTAILLGAITVAIIDKNFKRASLFSIIAAILSFVGFMHAPSLALNAAPDYTIGYSIIALFFIYCGYKVKASNTISHDNLIIKKIAS